MDIDRLKFQDESRFMSNRDVNLPAGTNRVDFENYEEITVPPGRPRKASRETVRVDEMPEWVQPAFANIRSLNEIQSRVYYPALFTRKNLLICAPTGAGKTNVALLGILNALTGRTRGKAVYIAPMKALVSETCGNLSRRLSTYDCVVSELTGDSRVSKKEINSSDVIVTTPEKWDVITRKFGSNTFLNDIRLIVIDEIHLLHDVRGAVLEAIVARHGSHRVIGLSATLPNYENVAEFLSVK